MEEFGGRELQIYAVVIYFRTIHSVILEYSHILVPARVLCVCGYNRNNIRVL